MSIFGCKLKLHMKWIEMRTCDVKDMANKIIVLSWESIFEHQQFPLYFGIEEKRCFHCHVTFFVLK